MGVVSNMQHQDLILETNPPMTPNSLPGVVTFIISIRIINLRVPRHIQLYHCTTSSGMPMQRELGELLRRPP